MNTELTEEEKYELTMVYLAARSDIDTDHPEGIYCVQEAVASIKHQAQTRGFNLGLEAAMGEVDKHFKGLVVMPLPEKSKEKLLKAISNLRKQDE